MGGTPRDRGFTLIEVTIATGLLVVIALGSAQLFALAMRSTASARQQLVMSLLAARKVDELTAAVAAGGYASSPADALDRAVDGFSDVAEAAGGRYVRRWLVTPLPGFDGSLVAVAVRVIGAAMDGRDVAIVTICRASA